jgi:hypothetical protein
MSFAAKGTRVLAGTGPSAGLRGKSTRGQPPFSRPSSRPVTRPIRLSALESVERSKVDESLLLSLSLFLARVAPSREEVASSTASINPPSGAKPEGSSVEGVVVTTALRKEFLDISVTLSGCAGVYGHKERLLKGSGHSGQFGPVPPRDLPNSDHKDGCSNRICRILSSP